MTTKFEKLRAVLENEKKRLIVELAQLEADTRSTEAKDGSPFGKREEEADESAELEKRTAIQKQLNSRLTEIEHALDKFAKGTYGLCDACGQAIDPARLEALPQANLCLNCKAKGAKG